MNCMLCGVRQGLPHLEGCEYYRTPSTPVQLTHIVITDQGTSDSGKTRRWYVWSKHDRATIIGTIEWFGKWRKYVFCPQPSTIYEEVCMRELSQFIVNATMLHRESKKKNEATP